jgi:PAS domain-containing protein
LSREVKQRKQAEEELAEKEAQLRVALDNMPGGMVLEDRDGNYVLFNCNCPGCQFRRGCGLD